MTRSSRATARSRSTSWSPIRTVTCWSYGLSSHYGTSGFVDLTAIGSVTCLSGGPDARTYAEALALGATRPFWTGGKFRLTVPAHEAFPVPCCYLLRLEAYKRTLESCVQDVRNVSEMTLGIGV